MVSGGLRLRRDGHRGRGGKRRRHRRRCCSCARPITSRLDRRLGHARASQLHSRSRSVRDGQRLGGELDQPGRRRVDAGSEPPPEPRPRDRLEPLDRTRPGTTPPPAGARRVGVRRAGGRAALPARRHRGRRPPRLAAARPGSAWPAALMALLTIVGTFVEYGTTSRAARWFGAGRPGRGDQRGRAGVLARRWGSDWSSSCSARRSPAPLTALLAGGPAPPSTRPSRGSASRSSACPACCSCSPATAGCAACSAPASRCGSCSRRTRCRRCCRPMLVYPAGLGLEGSAVANVAAQAVGGALFLRALRRAADEPASRPRGHAGAGRGRPRSDPARGGVPGRVPHGGRRRRPDGHRADRGAPDRAAAVGVHRAVARLVRHRRAVARRRRARRRRTPAGARRHGVAGVALGPVRRPRVRGRLRPPAGR